MEDQLRLAHYTATNLHLAKKFKNNLSKTYSRRFA